MKPESTHPTTFFLTKPKEGLAGGTTMAKTSPPPDDGSGIADTGATEEAGARAMEELYTGGAVEHGTKATKELDTGASEEVGAGALEELVPDVRLLQKVQDSKSRQRREIKCNRNMKTTHRRMMRGTSSSSSPSAKETRVPAEKRIKSTRFKRETGKQRNKEY